MSSPSPEQGYPGAEPLAEEPGVPSGGDPADFRPGRPGERREPRHRAADPGQGAAAAAAAGAAAAGSGGGTDGPGPGPGGADRAATRQTGGQATRVRGRGRWTRRNVWLMRELGSIFLCVNYGDLIDMGGSVRDMHNCGGNSRGPL